MNWFYLASLLAAWAGMALIDARYRLVLWRAPLRSVVLVLFSSGLLLLSDGWAIEKNIFVRGESVFLSGVWLAPHLPVEEPVFLGFLGYCTLVVFSFFNRHPRVISVANATGKNQGSH